MKKTIFTAIAAILSLGANAQDAILTLEDGATEVTLTLPSGKYTAVSGEQEVELVSDGTPLSVAVSDSQLSLTCTEGAMTSIAFTGQPVVGLDVSGSSDIRLVNVPGNKITSIKSRVSTAATLTHLYLQNNALTSFSGFSAAGSGKLIELNLAGNQLTSLSTTNYTKLEMLDVSDNELTSLTTSYMRNLKSLWCSGNKIKTLTLSSLGSLVSLDCSNNAITKITLPSSNGDKVKDFLASGNELTSLNLGKLTGLSMLDLSYNDLTSLEIVTPDDKMWLFDLSGTKLMYDSFVGKNKVTNYVLENLQNFDVYNDAGEVSTRFAVDENINLPTVPTKDASGNSLSTSVTWYNEAGSKLTAGTGKDLTQVKAKAIYKFNQGFTPTKVYAQIKDARNFTKIVLNSEMLDIYDPSIEDGIKHMEQQGFTFSIMPGALRMNSAKPVDVRVYDLNGRLVWSGTVSERGVEVNGLDGPYIVNGIKVVI